MRPDCAGHGELTTLSASKGGQCRSGGALRTLKGGKWVSRELSPPLDALKIKSHCTRLTLSFTKRHDEARRVCTFLNCLSYDAFGSNEKFVSRPLRRMKSEGRALGAFPFDNSFLFDLIFTFNTYYARFHSAIEAAFLQQCKGFGCLNFRVYLQRRREK